MLFQKYHVVIFKENTGTSRGFHSRGWPLVFFLLLLIGLSASSTWLYLEYQKLAGLRVQLAETELNFQEQHAQLVTLMGKLANVRTDLNRVQVFDSKLRVMMNMDGDLSQVGGAVGGPESETLSTTRLPLHRQDLMMRKMNAYLKQLSTETRLEELRQQELLLTMRHNHELLTTVPSIWPVEGFLTSRFGRRPSPFTGQTLFHKGLDIGARPGTPIHATAKGIVTFAGVDGAYGNCVVIEHGAGMSTRYAHMKRISVKRGQMLNRSETVGTVGSTGRSSGPHLHYEVRVNNVPVNPLRYILN